MFSLLHPSRGRFDKSLYTTRLWLQRARTDVELVVSIDEDDPQKERYLSFYPNAIVNKNKSAVEAINNAAKQAKGDIMIVVSDDSEPPYGWVKLLSAATLRKSDFVLKVNDGVQPWICTMPILDRKYYNRFGYVYHPDFQHMFCDTYFSHVADALKRVIWRNDLMFPHRHYSIMKTRPDDINRRADATWAEGKRTYMRMLSDNLLLDKSVNIYDLSKYAEDHLKWIKKNKG